MHDHSLSPARVANATQVDLFSMLSLSQSDRIDTQRRSVLPVDIPMTVNRVTSALPM